MKLIVVTTSDRTDHPGWLALKASLERFGYEYEHIQHPFSFGHQLPIIQHWANNYRGEATHLLYSDAWDTLALAEPDEVLAKFQSLMVNFRMFMVGDDIAFTKDALSLKMLISCEKNCYPHPERAKDYPETDGPWKYVNGGGWLVQIEYFKRLCQKENLNAESHDQVWLMEAYLKNQADIKLDTQCEIFQTIAFSNVEEWEKEAGFEPDILLADESQRIPNRRLRNIGTGTYPVFTHANGHTDYQWILDFLNL